MLLCLVLYLLAVMKIFTFCSSLNLNSNLNFLIRTLCVTKVETRCINLVSEVHCITNTLRTCPTRFSYLKVQVKSLSKKHKRFHKWPKTMAEVQPQIMAPCTVS